MQRASAISTRVAMLGCSVPFSILARNSRLRLILEAKASWVILPHCICNELFTWADVYDTANHDERRAILQQFIKEIRVRKDYEISITLNASFNQVEQLKAVSTYDGAEIFEEISEKGA